MFKGFNNRQQHSFPNINFGGNYGQAYNFSRCLLWLDAAYGTSTVVNGAGVSSWTDKINGVLYRNSTAGEQPTYVASDANFNNFPSLNFGLNVVRQLFGSNSFALGGSTIAIVVRNTAFATRFSLMLSDSSRGVGFGGAGNATAATGFGFYQDTTGFTKSDIEDTNMHIVIANRNFIIVDGINETIATSTTTFDFSQIGTNNSTCLACCIIAEILIYDYLMSETDAIQLSSNINAKYLKY